LADCITYVGLDVHKEGIVVAIAEGGGRGEVRDYGRIANTAAALDRLMGKLSGKGVRLRFCYEAGPCGYGIQRHLSAHGHECAAVAPSLIPRRAGDRVKTDRRDAAGLARLHRAGELTAVWVPDVGHEAMRDLVRARLDAVHALRRARRPVSGPIPSRPGGAWSCGTEMVSPETGILGLQQALALTEFGRNVPAPRAKPDETLPLPVHRQGSLMSASSGLELLRLP
jgi:Transposase